MFHIVFDSKGAQLITEAMDLDESLDGETIAITDDYSVGPIGNLFSDEGILERRTWWTGISEQTVGNSLERDPDSENIGKIVERMKEEEFDQIWIWIAPNARDLSGYYWLISQLKEFSGRVMVLHLNNLPFISEKGTVFYPASLSEIPVREFVKARKLARPVSPAEFETDPDEWTRLAAENKNLRQLDAGKKIIQREDDFYDRSLLQFLQPNFQKIPRVLHQFLAKAPEKPNELFLHWRLKRLIASGTAEQQGETIRIFVKSDESVNSESI